MDERTKELIEIMIGQQEARGFDMTLRKFRMDKDTGRQMIAEASELRERLDMPKGWDL